MAEKYYRVKEDTFMWAKGAILEFNSDIGSRGGYYAISDLWDAVELRDEYISANIIEAAGNDKFFERVYPIGDLKKRMFGSKIQAQAAAEALYKGDKK